MSSPERVTVTLAISEKGEARPTHEMKSLLIGLCWDEHTKKKEGGEEVEEYKRR